MSDNKRPREEMLERWAFAEYPTRYVESSLSDLEGVLHKKVKLIKDNIEKYRRPMSSFRLLEQSVAQIVIDYDCVDGGRELDRFFYAHFSSMNEHLNAILSRMGLMTEKQIEKELFDNEKAEIEFILGLEADEFNEDPIETIVSKDYEKELDRILNMS